MLAIVTQEQFDQLAEPVQNEYTRRDDGTYIAKIEPVGGHALEDVQGLRNTVATLRNEVSTANSKLKSFDGLDPEKARDALKVVKDLGGMTLEEKAAEAAKQREQQLIDKHNEAVNALSGTNKALREQLEEQLVHNVIVNALEENDDTVILPGFIANRVTMRESDNGTMVAVVLDENGNEAVGDSQGNPMTVPQLIDQMRGETKFARYFGGTGATGTGATGGAGGAAGKGGAGTKNQPKQIRADDQEAINANAEGIKNGTVVVVPGESALVDDTNAA